MVDHCPAARNESARRLRATVTDREVPQRLRLKRGARAPFFSQPKASLLRIVLRATAKARTPYITALRAQQVANSSRRYGTCDRCVRGYPDHATHSIVDTTAPEGTHSRRCASRLRRRARILDAEHRCRGVFAVLPNKASGRASSWTAPCPAPPERRRRRPRRRRRTRRTRARSPSPASPRRSKVRLF